MSRRSGAKTWAYGLVLLALLAGCATLATLPRGADTPRVLPHGLPVAPDPAR